MKRRLPTDADRKRVLSTVSIKSINSTTINSTVATLPRFETNRINRKSNQQLRFKQSPIKMSQPTTLFEQQTLKQSTKIVLKNSVFELEKLAQALNQQPSRQTEIANMCIELTNLLGQDFDKLEIYLIVLQNKCKTVSNCLGMLFSFVMAIILESYGHGKSAMQIYKHMCDMANKNQIFRSKLMFYYRMGMIYDRQKQYDKLIVIGKKLLKLSWYYGDQDYEPNAYYLIGKGYVGLQDMEMGVTFTNRYLDGVLQKNDHIKHIGTQQVALYNRRTQEPRHRSPSWDDFNLEIFREKIERNYIKMQMVGGKLSFKTQSSECDICAQYGRNHEKIQIGDQHPYKRDLIAHTDSRNRDFLGYFDSEQIQQLYIPSKTLPVLRQLLLKFISFL